MKLDVKQAILDYEGNPINGAGGNEPQQLREYLATALNNGAPGEVFTAEVKNKIYMLTNKLYAAKKEVELTIDDRSFIKERVGAVYSPLIYGRISELLEGTEPVLPPKDDANTNPPETTTTTTVI